MIQVAQPLSESAQALLWLASVATTCQAILAKLSPRIPGPLLTLRRVLVRIRAEVIFLGHAWDALVYLRRERFRECEDAAWRER